MYKCNKCKSEFTTLKGKLVRLPFVYPNILGTCPECGSTDFTNIDGPESPKVNDEVSPFDGDTLNVVKI